MGREPENVSVDVLPAGLLIVIQHCRCKITVVSPAAMPPCMRNLRRMQELRSVQLKMNAEEAKADVPAFAMIVATADPVCAQHSRRDNTE